MIDFNFCQHSKIAMEQLYHNSQCTPSSAYRVFHLLFTFRLSVTWLWRHAQAIYSLVLWCAVAKHALILISSHVAVACNVKYCEVYERKEPFSIFTEFVLKFSLRKCRRRYFNLRRSDRHYCVLSGLSFCTVDWKKKLQNHTLTWCEVQSAGYSIVSCKFESLSIQVEFIMPR